MADRKYLASAAPSGVTGLENRMQWAVDQAAAYYTANPSAADLHTCGTENFLNVPSRVVDGHTFPAFQCGLPSGTKQCVAVFDESTPILNGTWQPKSHVRV